MSPRVPPLPPILREKHFEEATAVCVLDPDGDMVRQLKSAGRARRDEGWACYHTELYRAEEDGIELGIVPFAVGASFAVLVAEELFTSGCKLLVSVTSSGQLAQVRPPPYLVLIVKAFRDEGTSYHYLPPSDFSEADPSLLGALTGAFDRLPTSVSGRPTRPSAKRLPRPRPCAIGACWRWRWRRPRCTPSHKRGGNPFSAWPTSPIAWALLVISRRVRRTALSSRSLSSSQPRSVA